MEAFRVTGLSWEPLVIAGFPFQMRRLDFFQIEQTVYKSVELHVITDYMTLI